MAIWEAKSGLADGPKLGPTPLGVTLLLWRLLEAFS